MDQGEFNERVLRSSQQAVKQNEVMIRQNRILICASIYGQVYASSLVMYRSDGGHRIEDSQRFSSENAWDAVQDFLNKVEDELGQ